MFRRYLPPSALPYRWLLLLTILLALIAVLPIGQKAQGPQNPQGQQTKKQSLNAVPGEILVRFRPQSKARQLGRQVVTEKTGRQIPVTVEAISA
jgi:hypothetical protein